MASSRTPRSSSRTPATESPSVPASGTAGSPANPESEEAGSPANAASGSAGSPANAASGSAGSPANPESEEAGSPANPVSGSAGSPTPAPLVLVARQGHAQARLSWENRGTETLRPRRAARRGLELNGPGAIGADLRVGGRIRPGERGDLRLSLALPPHTPPGVYPVSVQVGERALPVSIVMPEERQVVVTPSVIRLEGQPGAVFERVVVIENQGNVPVRLEAPAPTMLQARGHLHAMIWRALQRSPGARYEAFLNTLVAEGKAVTAPRQSRFIRPTLIDAPSELQPGQSVVVTMRVKIPQAVSRGATYTTRVSLGGAPLKLQVHRPRQLEAPEVRAAGAMSSAEATGRPGEETI